MTPIQKLRDLWDKATPRSWRQNSLNHKQFDTEIEAVGIAVLTDNVRAIVVTRNLIPELLDVVSDANDALQLYETVEEDAAMTYLSDSVNRLNAAIEREIGDATT